LILGYVRSQRGDAGVADVLALANVSHTLDELESDSRWVSYDTRIRLLTAAYDVLGDPDAMVKIGASAIRSSVSPSLVLLLRALGSPSQVFRQLPKAVGKFTTTSTLQMLEVTRTSAVIRFQLHEGFRHSRLDCQYALGLFTCVPELFGLPSARIVHDECESDGADACVYHVTWLRRSRWRRHAATTADLHTELNALRAQLEALQLAASDLVGSDDLDAVLVRIVEGAASAVLAQGYLLAVHAPNGQVVVRAAGVDPARRDVLAQDLLAGRDLGQPAVAVDVVSSRTNHGRLAVLYPPGQTGVPAEATMLRAYAGHAAAALDMLRAVADSRRDERRADALLKLSRQLAATASTQEVAQVVTAALPDITECITAGLLLWDEVSGTLQAEALVGFDQRERDLLLDYPLVPQDVPELASMLTTLRPAQINVDECGHVLQDMLTAVGLSHVIAVPLVAAGELLGVATISWRRQQPPDVGEADLTERLVGVADQAATALQNARLVSAVRHQALHDALTGLPNRVLFTDRLEQALRARSATAVGVLFCDLDRFKQVNDERGHAAGDELLRQVAERLALAVRQGDSVGRLSGDEFAVLLPDIEDIDDAIRVAHRVTACFDRPFRVEGEELRVTTSVGVAVHHGPDGRVDRLLRAADAAMYDAKQRGRNQVSTAQHGMQSAAGEASLERELAEAIEAGQLRLLYQPIVDVVAGVVVGAEALVRWQHPRLGLLGPVSFLPLAEETQLIVDIDTWVMREACRFAASAPEPLQIAVNLSGRTLADPLLVNRVRETLAETGLPAERLELEVVESRALVDLAGVDERLEALRRLGVRVALDDFGTGYSTLAWLQMLPVDQLKVDRSFTAKMDNDAWTAALVRGVVALADEVGLNVVAEGVETVEQLAAVRACGVRYVQGYLLGRPSEQLQPPSPGILAAVDEADAVA
jgi:diguanylate cyclase (GGDEF)-like protein